MLIQAYVVASVVAVYLIFFVVMDSPPYDYGGSDNAWLYHAPLSGGLVIMLIVGQGFASLPWSLLLNLAFVPVVGFAISYVRDIRGRWPLWLALYTFTWLIMCCIAAIIYARATVS